jgi:hypothetical protein
MYKRFLSITLMAAFLVPAISLAYAPTLNNTTIPYKPQIIDSAIGNEAQYLGLLAGDPHMYEFTIGVATTLTLRLSQRATDTPAPFSLIAVRENTQNAGVVEVGRLRAKDISWEEKRDWGLGLTLTHSPTFEAEIGPGVYRVEVSTPENAGAYMLTIGTNETPVGYFKTLADVRMIQKFFGVSILAMLLSTYVFYLLGIILLIALFYYTWRNRLRLQKYAA